MVIESLLCTWHGSRGWDVEREVRLLSTLEALTTRCPSRPLNNSQSHSVVVTAAVERGKQHCGNREPGAVSTCACKVPSSLSLPSLPLESTNWNGIYLEKYKVLCIWEIKEGRDHRQLHGIHERWREVGQAASGEDIVSTGTDKRKASVQGTDCLKHKVWVPRRLKRGAALDCC